MRKLVLLTVLLGTALVTVDIARAQRVLVPGTGHKVELVGDDFEDPEWTFIPNLPKSSKNINEFTGGAGGKSQNGRWYEGVKRGQPDYIRRVATPPGGLPGSEGALMLRSLQTGVPGRPSFRTQQDDFICNIHYRMKGTIPVSQSPSFVVRVFLPPIDQWEERTGPSFAVRSALTTRIHDRKEGWKEEIYWPGMFIEFESKERSGREHDFAYLRMRANSRGGDFRGPQITQTGWWTFGMSNTPDGQVHFFAKPGIEDLTQEDHIVSTFPYGYRCQRFMTFFFNVCNGDDNRTWSTPWVIDDPTFYLANPQSATRAQTRR